jgi:metabotropic glutamate receptor 2/3
MVLAVRMVNEDATLLPNINLAFDIRDTCLSINFALQQSVDYIQTASSCSGQLGQGVSAVVGPFQSSISEPSANLFGLFEVPQVSYGSSATLFSEDRFSFFFRTIPSDMFQARALVDIITRFGWEYVILLHSNDLYGIGGSDALEMEMKESTNCIATRIPLSGDPSGYENAVNRMDQDWVRNASVALLFGHLEDAIGIFRVIQERVEENPDFPLQNLTWIGTDSWGDNLPDEYRPMAKGMLSTVPESEVVPEFDSYFTSLNPFNNMANPWFIEYWENEFMCNLGLSPSLENCTVDQQAISVNATNYSQFSLVPLVLDATFALAYSIQDLVDRKCQNGGLCSDIVSNGVVDGALLRDALLNVTFPSRVVNISRSFDENGDVSGSYSVLNLQKVSTGQYRYVQVGSWDPLTALSIDEENIMWVTGEQVPQTICTMPCREGEVSMRIPRQPKCCFRCRRCVNNTAAIDGRCAPCDDVLGMQPNENHTSCILIPISFLAFSNPWAIILTILSSIGVVATSVVITIFLVFYKHELIKASSRELSAILLVGLLFCFIVPFFYIAKPSAAICGIRRFSLGFCFAVSYSALLVKTNRIYRIFSRQQNPSAKPLMFISPLSQVLITLAFLSVQVVIGIIWLAVEIPATEVVPSSTSNELTCASSPVINLIVALAYNLFLLILCTYFAFLTRKVPTNFNETKFINVTVYSTGLIWLAFIPTFFATSSLGTIFQTTTLAFGIIFSATTALCCLFISKVVLLNSRIRKQRKTENTAQSQSGSLPRTTAHSFSASVSKLMESTETLKMDSTMKVDSTLKNGRTTPP